VSRLFFLQRRLEMAIAIRRRNITRLLLILLLAFSARLFFSTSSLPAASPLYTPESGEIREHNVLERVRPDKTLNVQKHKFLQVRMGRDERKDILGDVVRDGVLDYWERFQKP
jgi:hypothetical protein